MEVRTELDSHADTTVVGQDTALLIYDYDTPVQVHGYNDSVGQRNCRTVSAVAAYDHPGSGQTYMLVLHQAILIPDLQHNLLCPMQLRDNGILVNDEPKYLMANAEENHHAITIQNHVMEDGEVFRIPLSLHGVTSYFTTRKPSKEEFESTPDELCIDLTAESPPWDPTTTRFSEQESAMTTTNGRLVDTPDTWPTTRMIAALHTLPQSDVPDSQLAAALQSHVQLEDTTVRSRNIGRIKTGTRKAAIGPTTLAKNWGIGLEQAQRTVDATTQRGVRTLLHGHLNRRYRTNDRQLRYRRLTHDVYTDTLDARIPSWHRKNKYAQVFGTRFGWTRVYPMRHKSEAHEGLSLMAKRDGVPPCIIMDGAKEQTMGTFRKKAQEMDCHVKQTEPYSPWSNAAEGTIRELKRAAGRKALKKRSPLKLWDHCIELESLVRSNTALNHPELDGQVPETIMTGQTPDISCLAEYGWYDWVVYWDKTSKFPDMKEVYGKWLGPAKDIGPAMTAKILKANGQVIYTSSYRPLNEHELTDDGEKERRATIEKEILATIGPPISESDLKEASIDAETPEYEPYDDDVDGSSPLLSDSNDATPEDADNYVGASVNLPFGGTMLAGTVKRRTRDEEGNITGKAHQNPILDTRVYDVEFPGGQMAEFSANAIAEHMYAQCDADGNQYLLLDAITDHKTDWTAVKKADQYIVVNGRRHLRKTTVGWKLCILWKDGSTSWERLVDIKQSYPIELAEYAIANALEQEPAFEWWVPYVMKKRKRVLAAVAKRYQKRTHKLGFEIPKSVKRAYEIDIENGNSLWRDAIAKEMSNVRVAFNILDENQNVPPGYQFMDCHMVFDIKMDGFRRKARLVAGGHMTEAPAVMTYASVVSRETVRIALTIAALNDLEVKASDIQNAYLTAPCEEKIYTTLGPEFGEDKGKTAIIVRALYGLKSAGSSYWQHISDCMYSLNYKRCKADADLWMKPMTRPDDGFKYYSYILLYVDDVLAISHDAMSSLREIDKYFHMKPDSIGDPDIYLGAKLRQNQLDNGVFCWSMSSSKYVQEAVANVEEWIGKNLDGLKLRPKVSVPWPAHYTVEDDGSPELGPQLANYYQHLVGVMHWILELGRVDIITEVSLLASQMAMPRRGHLDAALHVIAYLKCKHNARMVFDPSYPPIDLSAFPKRNWNAFYGDVHEPIPPNAPPPFGNDVDLRLFVDSDHAGDKTTRRSRTGFFIFLNSALIQWVSKKQATIETSVFGAEFVAMKHGMETCRGIRYKLRMMGVPLTTPTYIYGDNMSVINNTTKPESVLKKKSNEICYHAVRESVAMDESRTTHVETGRNFADLATKVITNGPKRQYLVGNLLYDVYD